MTKLSDRLRKVAISPNYANLADICLQAASTIDRLEKTIAEMKDKTNA